MISTQRSAISLIYLLLILSLGIVAQAQDDLPDLPGRIFYERVHSYEESIYVKQIWVRENGDAHLLQDVPLEDCYAISPTGEYLVLYYQEEKLLRIIDTVVNAELFSVKVDINCSQMYGIDWSTNNFSVRGNGVNTVDLFSGEVVNKGYGTPPILPAKISRFYLQSPAEPQLYVYVRCLGREYRETDFGILCLNELAVVIYDTETEQVIDVIDDAIVSLYSEGYEPHPFNINWSPSGQYLTYPGINGFLMIYDFFNNRVATEISAWEFATIWSPDELYIASVDFETVFSIFSLESQTTRDLEINNPHGISPTIWSPDNNYIAYSTYHDDGNEPNTIIMIELNDGSQFSLDEDVTRLLAWTP